MSVSYIHIHHDLMQVGHIIQPGSMGKIIFDLYAIHDTKNYQQITWRMLQEQTFELIRLTEFAHLPSRYKSIFLFERLQDAQKYIERFQLCKKQIYEVEVLDRKARPHRASMTLYERVPLGRATLPALSDQARQYWQGVNTMDTEINFEPEVLVESAVVIKKILTST